MKQVVRKQQRIWPDWLKIIAIGASLTWIFAGLYLNFLVRPTWPAAVQNYTIPQIPSRFQPIWSLNDAYDAFGDIVLSVTETEALFHGDFHPTEPIGSLHRLDLLTGEIKGVVRVSRRTEGVASNNRLVYVSVPGGKVIDSETLRGVAQVVAYDIESGRQVWSQPIRGARSADSMSVFGGIVTVVSDTPTTANRYQHLNALTGSVQYSNDREYPVLYSGDVWYIIRFKPVRHVAAVDSRTNTLLWEQKAIYPYHAPSLSNGVIAGRTGERIGYAYGIDSGTGALLWRSDDSVYSNIAIGSGVVFYLTEQAELKAVNVRTGQVVATLQFEPEALQEGLTQQRVYNVAASGNIVVVYLGDSRQLFAFRFSPGN